VRIYERGEQLMKRIGVVALIIVGLLAVFVGTASGSLPGTHITSADANCAAGTLKVTFHLKDVPAGIDYLAVVNGAAQKSQQGTTDGANQIVVNIPIDCATVCDQTLVADMALAGGDISEDTPFESVLVTCGTPPPSTTSTPSTVQVSGSTVQATTSVPSASRTSSPGGISAVLGASTTHTGGTSAVSGSSLPFTGGTALPLLAIGLAAIGAGTGLVVSGKRRADRRS